MTRLTSEEARELERLWGIDENEMTITFVPWKNETPANDGGAAEAAPDPSDDDESPA